MAKFITLVVLVVGLVSVLSINKYQELPVKNEKFDFEAEKKAHEQHLLTLEEIEKAKHHVEKVEEEVEVEEPKELVVLDTPELVAGHKLYSKCIACHGKRGEGKKSQKAPRIGGQLEWYITSSLAKMQSKERVNKVMDPYIKNLSQDDLKALAAYISKLPWEK